MRENIQRKVYQMLKGNKALVYRTSGGLIPIIT